MTAYILAEPERCGHASRQPFLLPELVNLLVHCLLFCTTSDLCDADVIPSCSVVVNVPSCRGCTSLLCDCLSLCHPLQEIQMLACGHVENRDHAFRIILCGCVVRRCNQ